ncbi:MAG: hypothetical protein U9O94_07130 [Nanoarchaeota archaeon]|nr:hypothetical protein [Nanoarchaeota archaeon]
MANTKLQPIAMFMICLIVTLPIYISSVYADINSVRGYGEAGAENFVTKQYDLMVEADVSLDGKNITPEQLKIRHEEGLYTYFDSCVSKSNSTDYLCKISGIRSATSEIELCPSSSFNIELYEDKFSTTPVDVETLPIKCDAKPPSLILSVSPHLSKGENISLSYEAHDPENSQTKCSGVDKLEIYPNGLEGGAATILMNSTSCYQSGRVPIVASDYSDDKFIIYVKAYDRLGQSSMANTTFIVDKTGPDASASISITDLSGKTVEYFRPQTILADVILNISDLAGVEDYNLDYSGLTSTAPICSSVVTDVICEWTNIQLHMDNAEFSRKIIMQAEDVLGNNATREITVETSVKQDLNPPQISNFKILRLDGKNMGGENISRWIPDEEFSAKAYIDVSDKGSGLDSVNGDFSIINPLYSDYLIGDCNQISKTGNESLPEYKYRCSWDLNVHFNTSGNPLNAQFRINATDNALNYATPTFTKSFNVDVDGPVVTKLKTNWFFDNVYYVGTGGNSFTATIRDDGIGISTDVYLDADSIRLGNNVKADNCSGSFCYWHLQGVAGAEEGLHAVSVKTNTMDSLGNNMDEPFALNVMLDSTAPVLNSINVTPVAANTELFQDFIQTGNALYIVADITESTSLP